MQNIILPLILGVIVSLIVFLFFERQAIEAKRKSEKEGLKNTDISLPENFRRYK